MSYTYRMTPRFTDFDSYKIVHHSNYFRFVEEARFHFIKHVLGNDMESFLEQDYKVVITESKCKYINYINSNHDICIDITFIFYKNTYLICEFTIYNDVSTTVYAKGQTKHCFIDNNNKIMLSYPESFIALFKKLSNKHNDYLQIVD